MSVVQYPEPINTQNLQIYNNAAFDAGANPSSAMQSSWVRLQSVSVDQPETLESDSSKENRIPAISSKSPPLTRRNSHGKPLKLLFKQGLLSPPLSSEQPEKFDKEIEEIEKEINRLSSRLEALRIEKAAAGDSKVTRRQSIGRIVPAKFMEQKQSIAKTPATATAASKKKKNEQSPAAFQRRGVSLGPSEIASAVSSRQSGKPPEITPFQQSRRKSCFWKLPGIEEEEGTGKKGGRSLSLSPKSRLSIGKIVDPRRPISTVGAKKAFKWEDSSPLTKNSINSIKPKKLSFKDEDRVIAGRGRESRPAALESAKKKTSSQSASKNSRVVPSRYNQTYQAAEKRTPGNLQQNLVPENRVKRRWDLQGGESKRMESSPSPSSVILEMAEALPKIRAVRLEESISPRDSGPAKRVADLIGRKSYFEDDSICQLLSFEEEEKERQEEQE